ncbi:MAG: DUF4384 domain-containing protein [Nitrospirales bacterium]|nr:DUF4384 domain-containing protein [Nitrospirales bacterium]
MPPSHRQMYFGSYGLTLATMTTIVGLLFLFPSSGRTGFLDSALDFGKDLLGKAAINYSNKYEQKLTRLLQSLRQPVVGNQSFIQGIIPGNPYDPNAFGGQNPYDSNGSYGTTNPNYGNQLNPYGQNPGYYQGAQQDGYARQPPGMSYPTDPNYGVFSPGDPNAYSQGQGSYDPYNPNQGYPPGGGYGQYPNQTSPVDPNYGNNPYGQLQPYDQGQGGYPLNDPNRGSSGYPSTPYPQQGGQNPSHQYGGERYSGQPDPLSPQGRYDPYQPQGQSPQSPAYTQPATPSYPSNPSVEAPTPPAIGRVEELSLDVALVKKTFVNGAETLTPIQDGDILKDGRGNAKAGEKFRMMFRANTDCYVYVIAIDGSAWAQGVFPSLTSPFANPIKQGQQYVIPDNNNWFSLDQFKGIETVFFVASPDKRQDIEEILASIGGRERHPATTPQQVTEAPIIPAGFYGRQQSTTPFTLGQSSASDQDLMPTTYFTQKAGEALRVTRWFRHE